VVGLVGATLLLHGRFGMTAYSRQRLVRRLVRIYVEVIRDIPLLLQPPCFWYFCGVLSFRQRQPSLANSWVVLAKSGALSWPGFRRGWSWRAATGKWDLASSWRFSVEFRRRPAHGLITYNRCLRGRSGCVAASPLCPRQWEAAHFPGDCLEPEQWRSWCCPRPCR